jgi:hypothetical protein
MRRLQISRTFSVSMALTVVAICALGIAAQSGRRARKPETPAPVPTPEATPVPTPADKPALTFKFIVGMERFGDFSRISLYTYSGVLRSCADRLGDSGNVKAGTTSRELSRADAIRQAKAETEAYVVWLQLRANNSSGRATVYDDPNNVYVQYTVFAPTTAKQVTSGNTFPEAYRNSRIRVPTSTTNGDYYLNQAARGAAERILDHFHLHPSVRVPDRSSGQRLSILSI